MKSFENLEREHSQSPVRFLESNTVTASGVLVLNGNQSELVLSSSENLEFVHNESGWFNLKLQGANGQTILLQNALTILSSTHHQSQSRPEFTEKIFPNVVVFNAQFLEEEACINRISFSFPAMKFFFHYQFMERFGIHNADITLMETIEILRKKKNRKSDFSNPTELYIVHHPEDDLLNFEIDGRQYSVSLTTRTNGLAMNQIDVVAEPIGTIAFVKPLKIDEALDFVWEWRRFFEQMAFSPINVTSVSVRSPKSPPYQSSDVYLPNVDKTMCDIRPYEIPLNRRENSNELAKVTREWLLQEDTRRIFRVSLSRVIERSRHCESLDDIVTMCAAIESMSELKEPSSLLPAHIEIISNAAVSEANKHNIAIDSNRIRGVLKLLENQSLPRQLKVLTAMLPAALPKKDVDRVMKVVLDLRKVAAHGHTLPEITMPKIWPTVQALLSICILFDLSTSGVPITTNESSFIVAIKKFREAIDRLNEVENR